MELVSLFVSIRPTVDPIRLMGGKPEAKAPINDGESS
jgi:hypothetical protein